MKDIWNWIQDAFQSLAWTRLVLGELDGFLCALIAPL